MCNLSDGIERRGIERGKVVGMIRIARKQLCRRVELSDIADLLDVELAFVIQVKERLEEMQDASDEEIATTFFSGKCVC